jgi:hypothetical protein
MAIPEGATREAAPQPHQQPAAAEAALTFPKKEISVLQRPFGLISAVGQMLKVDVWLFSMFPGKIGEKARAYLKSARQNVKDFWQGRRDYTKEEYDSLSQEEKDNLWERAEAGGKQIKPKQEQPQAATTVQEPQPEQPQQPAAAPERKPLTQEDVAATLETFQQQFTAGKITKPQWELILNAAKTNYGWDTSRYQTARPEVPPEQQLQSLATGTAPAV